MIITSIELQNYRNYPELHIRLDKGTNILYGDIDYIKGVPLGKLAVNLRGDPEQVKKSLAFLREHKVNVEMLK